jgi:hypothetical protein
LQGDLSQRRQCHGESVTDRIFKLTMDNLEFILLDINRSLIKEWKDALNEHVPEVIDKFSVVESTLENLKSGPHEQFDCIVSPANSYGRLDGG